MARPGGDGARPSALFLAADLPWPRDGGGRIATLHILESMCRRYDVDLVAMADPVAEPDLQYLRSICRSVEVVRIPFTFGRHRIRQLAVLLRSLASREPYRVRKFRSARFEAAVRRQLAGNRYDVFHCDQFGALPYVRLAPAEAVTTAVHHNVESDIYRLATEQASNPMRRLFASNERRKLARAERLELSAFDRVFVLAANDAELLRDLGIDRTTVIPMPAPKAPRVAPAQGAPTQSPPPPRGHRILSLGSMSWYGVADGLLWFHDDVLPAVRAAVPDVEWELVGPNAPASIRRLEGEPGVVVTGYAQEIAPHLQAARVGIVPLRIAGGVRLKLLDFLAWGLPAVATTVGARGLDIPEGSGCFQRDDPDAFAAAVVELLNDDALWTRVAGAGRDFVQRNHSAASLDEAMASGIEQAYRTHLERSAR